MEIVGVVAIDANALISLCGPQCEAREKLEHLLAQIDKAKGKLLIPTPAAAEFLVGCDQAALDIHNALVRRSAVLVGNFDLSSAHELALLDAAAIGRGDKRDSVITPWQKVKIDRQIVAIARRHGATLIVSNDDGVRTSASRFAIRAIQVDDLDLPDSARQQPLPIDHPPQG